MKRAVSVLALCWALLSSLALVRPPDPALADAASIVGGGGGTVRPMDNPDIQLRSEYIRVQVHWNRAEFLVVYDFVNTTGREQTVRMGFPERAAFMDEEKLQDFTVMDSDQPVSVQLEPGEPEGSVINGQRLPPMDYYVFELDFAPGEAKRVTNAYWAWSTEYRGLHSLDYYLHTGATWKGPIESVDVLVSLDPELVFPGPGLKKAGLDSAPAGYTLDSGAGQMSWHFDNLEPTPDQDLKLLYLHAGRPYSTEMIASSVLDGSKEGSGAEGPGHYPLLVMDGDRATAWAEGETGPGLGQWIMADFQEPGGYVVYRVGVLPGWAKEELFTEYNRVKSATLHFSDGTSRKIELEDKQAMQFFEIEPVRTAYVKLVIDQVYRGTRYDDTCISEMEIHTSN